MIFVSNVTYSLFLKDYSSIRTAVSLNIQEYNKTNYKTISNHKNVVQVTVIYF